MHISKGSYPVTLLPPPRRLVPSLGLGTTWVRQLRSGSCHHPTAATKCNEQPSRATANPVGGKACSSTKGGLLRYIPNTYSIHKVSSLKFAYFQGKLSRYTNAIMTILVCLTFVIDCFKLINTNAIMTILVCLRIIIDCFKLINTNAIMTILVSLNFIIDCFKLINTNAIMTILVCLMFIID